MRLPNYISKYLWDVNPKNISPKSNPEFIIERVLEYGDLNSLKWIVEKFKKEIIIDVLKKSKKISPKTGNFYSIYFKVPKGEILCIRKPFTQKQNRF